MLTSGNQQHRRSPPRLSRGRSFRDELTRAFDRFFYNLRFPDIEPLGIRSINCTAPAAAFSEDEKVYAVTAELPGVEPGAIDVTVSGRLLVINGENRHEKEKKKKNYHFCERSYGSFRRVFALPENVDQEKIAASFANGVLTVILPKGREVEKSQRKIEVKTQAAQAV